MYKKIMLIDDDYSTNFYHEIILEDAGIIDELIICSSVDEAIGKLKAMEIEPNLIFLDMNMPIKNAWDFLHEYEVGNLARSSKVVILSTTKNPNDVQMAVNNKNVFAFLTKPLQIDFVTSFFNQETHSDFMDPVMKTRNFIHLL